MSCEIRSMITAYFCGSSIRIPPIFTNSASTPSTFIELIFSTKAGGNVFSIPNKIPIFFIARCSVIPIFCRSEPDRKPGEESAVTLAALKVLPRHLQPKRPIMLRVIPPNVQPVRNRLPIQNRRELHVLIQTYIPIRRPQHNFHLPVAADWDICLDQNVKFSAILNGKAIPHWLDVWGDNSKHDWPLWLKMAGKYF